MNHGKSNSPVTFCPTCGEKFSSSATLVKNCTEEKHRERRKTGSKFCVDCGRKFS